MSEEKRLFVYKRGISISSNTLGDLRKAGIIPIAVDSLNDCQLISATQPPVTGSQITVAAIKAMASIPSADGTRRAFVQLLADSL